jgi:hypothetical protein
MILESQNHKNCNWLAILNRKFFLNSSAFWHILCYEEPRVKPKDESDGGKYPIPWLV